MPRDKQEGLTSRVVPQLGQSNRRPGAGKAMWSVIDKTWAYKGYAQGSTRAGNVLHKPRPVPQNYGYQRMAAPFANLSCSCPPFLQPSFLILFYPGPFASHGGGHIDFFSITPCTQFDLRIL